MIRILINIKSIILLCAFFALTGYLFSQNKSNEIKNLESKINSANGQEKVDLLIEYSKLLIEDKELAINTAKKALNLAREINNAEKRISAQANLGDLYSKYDDNKKAIEHLQSAMIIAEEIKENDILVKLKINLADIYAELSNFEKALDLSKEALNLSLKLDKKLLVAESYHNIGIVYYYLANFENSLNYNKKAFDIFKELKDTAGIAKSYSNLALVYSGLDSIEKSLSYNFKALNLMQSTKNGEGIANAYSNIGLAFLYSFNYEESIKYLNKALEIYDKSGSIRNKIIVLSNLGYAYLDQKNFAKALEYAKTAEILSKDIQSVDIKALVYNLSSEIFKSTGDYKLALEYKGAFYAIKDSIFNAESKEKITELEIRIQTEHENELLKQRNKLQTIFFVTSSFLIFIILIILFLRFRLKQKSNKLLEEKNQKITEQNTTLEFLNKELSEANLAKDRFFSIMAHDLKSPLWWFKNVTDLLANKYDQLSKEKIMEITKVLDESAQTSLHLIENLLQWSRAQSGKIEFIPEEINLNHVFKHIMAHHRLHAEQKKISIEVNIPESATMYADKNMLYSILRNLISNSIKFTKDAGKIAINFKEEENNFIFSIKDNGVGIEKDKIDKIFRIDIQTTTLGTNQEKGTGLGLIITKEFIQKHGGTIAINSELGNGTEFVISIPKKLPNN